MKLGNIIIGLIVIVGGFTGCDSDNPADERLGGEASLSLTLEVKDTQTNETKAIATADELKISTIHVAVFDDGGTETKGQLITSIDYTGNQVVADSQGLYTFKNITVRTFGKETQNVKVLVFANLGDKNVPTSFGNSYEEYKKATVTSGAFISDKLVKVGEKIATLSRNQKTDITVELVQLTVRLDFGGITVDGAEQDGLITYSKTQISNSNNIPSVLKNYITGKYAELGNKIGYQIKSKPTWQTGGYYKIDNNARLIIVAVSKNDPTLKCPVLGSQVSGLCKKSNLVIENPYVGQSADDKESYEGNTFYSYACEEGRNDLKVYVDCTFLDEGRSSYGCFLQKKTNNSWSPLIGNVSSEKIYSLVGSELVPITDLTVWGTLIKTFTLDLASEKLLKGHRYTISGVYYPKIGADIKWSIVDMDQEEIERPPFK